MMKATESTVDSDSQFVVTGVLSTRCILTPQNQSGWRCCAVVWPGYTWTPLGVQDQFMGVPN
jgi:hypothetical protein